MRRKLFISLVLFVLALLPRLPDLGRFLTADEFLWVDRSRNFLAGLTNPAYECTTVVETWELARGLACTLRTGHPGVTTMWTGSLGFLLRWLSDGRPGSLHDYVVAVSTDPLDASFIAPERFGTVLLTSLWVVAVYWLARRLLGGPVALLAAVLIALDPFHVALSRVIHHDALSTTFMTLSLLCAFLYWGESRGWPVPGRSGSDRRWLFASGALAGFAFLSKSPALFLMPFIALAGLWFWGERWKAEKLEARHAYGGGARWPTFVPSLAVLTLDGLLWFAAAAAVFFIFWPAMWVVPLETLQTVIFIGSKYATGGHAKGNFFLGEISQDPGFLFYPVTWLYRTSPPVVLGVATALLAWRRQRASESANQRISESANRWENLSLRPFYRYLPLILLFILGYYLLMTIGEKKQDRYFLPAYPWFNLIAAGGLVTLARGFVSSYSARRGRPAAGQTSYHVSRITFHFSPYLPSGFTPVFTFLLLLTLALNGALLAVNFPYYFTYYNPLLGGIQGAARAVTIGWGEGLDLAAAYLNERPDAVQTRVASWYESTFTPFYHGPSISYSKEKGKALAGDYVIFYINQTQRRFPDDIFFEYFEQRFKPAKVITLAGLDYAWIYPSLGVDHYIQDQTYTGIASFLAWQWLDGDGPLQPGRPAGFELYWEYLGKRPDEPFFFRLVDNYGRAWAEARSQPIAGMNPSRERWREGEIIVEQGRLDLPPDIAPGEYRLQVGFYTNAPAVAEGELLFEIPPEEALVTVGHAPNTTPYALPLTASPIEQPLGAALTLLGAAWPGESLPRSPAESTPAAFPLDLYWRVERPLPANAAVHVALMDEAGAARQAWFELSLAETFNPDQTTWQPGDILHTRWQLDLLPEVPPGLYHLELVWPADTSQSLPFGQLTVRP